LFTADATPGYFEDK